MWFMHDGWMWGWMAFGMLFNLIFWGAIIFLAVWAIKRFTEARPGNDRPFTPEEIAKARYARGEINREQYEELLRDLRR